MQNPQIVAGARGWLWRVDAVERFGRTPAPAFVHLSRRGDSGDETLTAVRPYEALAHVAWREELRPVHASVAAAVAEDAKRGERIAFRLPGAERLRGDIHAWQLVPALAFARGFARVLAADDAGMGKTVSAALAIAQCLDGAGDRRCLVLAPGHLLGQWQHELRARLAIDTLLVDAGALARVQREIPAGVPVWSLPGCVIASIDFVKQPHVRRSLESVVWDLLVIDEAHLSCGVTDRREAASLIARRSRRVLLLTATPSDGGGDRLQALRSLGAAAGDAPLIHVRHTAAGRARVDRRVWIAPGAATRDLHRALAAYTQWIACTSRIDTPAVALLCSLLTKRALSSPHALRISIARRLALLGRDPQPVQASLFEPDDDPGVLGAATGLPIERERTRLAAMLELAGRAARGDRRLRALTRMVRRAREPVVIFTCFRDTALLLAKHLSARVRVCLVHGELPQAAIDSALHAFTAGPAQVLVATDVAAQGLNLHRRCRWVVHYDLPWRPSSMRQRFGRVDRIGQTRRAHATLLLDRTPLAASMLDRVMTLTAQMHAGEQPGSRRWDVIAAAEARRLLALRAPRARPTSAPLACRDAAVVEIGLVDAAGQTIDRSVMVIAGRDADADAWARNRAALRGRQLRRALVARAERRICRERAVLAAALETSAPSLRQQGLFDRRADRHRQHDAAVARALSQAARDAVDRYALEGRIGAVRTRTLAAFHFDGI